MRNCNVASLIKLGIFEPAGDASDNSRKIMNIYLADRQDRVELWSKFGKIPKESFDEENQKLVGRDATRRKAVSELISAIASPSKEDYYFSAAVFNHGSRLEDYAIANDFADKSRKLGYFKPEGMDDNHWLYAATRDRLLLAQNRQQEYGTNTWAPNHPDEAKRGALVCPEGAQMPDIGKIEAARHDVGIQSLKDERADRGLPPLEFHKASPNF